jgi:hypothetical protein
MDIDNIVNGVNFKKISTVILDVDNINERRIYDYKNIIFCKTDLLPFLFKEICDHDSKNILITHQSDYDINKHIFESKPKNIIKWFAQNVNHKNEDLIPLPIGIENHTGPSKGNSIDLNFIKKFTQNYSHIEKKIDKIYCNFNLNNHHSRNNVKNFLLQNELCDLGTFGIPYELYCSEIRKYLFVASPRGNGIDCHRTWESLLMGSIPIVEKHFMYDSYKNLPIIQINSWSKDEIIKNMEKYIELYYQDNLFTNMEEITMSFWNKKILNFFNSL